MALKGVDPDLAAYSLRVAEQDWKFGVQGLRDPTKLAVDLLDVVSKDDLPLIASEGVLASLQLLAATGQRQYADEAVELAPWILNSQQRTFLPALRIPLTGFFYTEPNKQQIRHYFHRGHEQAPIFVLARLCAMLPNHPDWMKWYSAVVLHSEYLRTISQNTEPYGMLASSIYKEDEYLQAPDVERASFQRQILNGIKAGDRYYLRLFPVWSIETRGNDGRVLSQAKALSIAARLRNNLDLTELAQRQLEWVVGRNPFAESIMYGEGYDYAPQFAPLSGEMLGSIPVGIESWKDRDVPYWPLGNCYTWKEVWTHAVSRWIWLMEDLSGSATVQGKTLGGDAGVVSFPDLRSGKDIEVTPDLVTGEFRAVLSQGKYEVRNHGLHFALTLLPAETYRLDLRPDYFLSFDVAKETGASGQVTVKLTVHGSGTHRFRIRTENLRLTESEKPVEMREGKVETLKWQAQVEALNAPWVAVVVPDGDLSQ